MSTSTCLTLALMSSWYNQDLMKFLSAFATRAFHLVTEKKPNDDSNLFAQFWVIFLSEIFENSFLWNLIYCSSWTVSQSISFVLFNFFGILPTTKNCIKTLQ